MKMITSLDAIKTNTNRIYVRWSNSFAKDAKRGYSIAYGSQSEAGISCCEINTDWADWRIVRQITEYRFTGAKHCYIITGDLIGKGEDGEPLLANISLIGEVSKDILDIDWMREEITARIADIAERINRITDEIALELENRSLAESVSALNAYNNANTEYEKFTIHRKWAYK